MEITLNPFRALRIDRDPILDHILGFDTFEILSDGYDALLRGVQDVRQLLALACSQAFSEFLEENHVDRADWDEATETLWWPRFLPLWIEREKKEQLETRYIEALAYLTQKHTIGNH